MNNSNSIEMSNDSLLESKWLTVGLLMVVVLMLSRVVGVMDNTAYAEMAVSENGYTMMTTDGGTDEVLVIVDSREEMIMVYRASPASGNQGGVELLDREALSGLFQRARARAIGSP